VRVDQAAGARPGSLVGELLRRTENLLQVQTDSGAVTVEVPNTAAIDIASIPGDNTVNQLSQHLEIQRMSKSKGNVVNPDDLVREYGADTVRTYLMFVLEWQKGGAWDSHNIIGCSRFVEDVWKLATTTYTPDSVDAQADVTLRRRVHQTIAKVDAEMHAFKWNTAVAALMSLRNDMVDALRTEHVSADVWNESVDVLLRLFAPIGPHVTEELWHLRGNTESIHLEPWPESDAAAAREDTVTMVLQVNGKVRDRVDVAIDISSDDAEAAAMASDRMKQWIGDNQVRKVIVREPNLVNVVI